MHPRPQLIAHRGLHDTVPENTIQAFERALAAGAEAIEFDVHGTSDGAVVVHHDERIAGIPRDPSLRGRSIAEITAEHVAAFDVGGGVRPPRLDEALSLMRGRAVACVELKARGIEELVAGIIEASGAQCAVHAFDHATIGRLGRIAPRIPRGILERRRRRDPVAALRRVAGRDLWQRADTIDAELVRLVQAAGCRVIAWTANSPDEWSRLDSLGVDGICTDRVDDLRDFLVAPLPGDR